MMSVFSRDPLPVPSFWWLQAAGWGCFYVLSVAVVMPYVGRLEELGYRDFASLLTDQGVMCVGGFLASLLLRPVCRSLARQSLTWLALEVRAAGWCLVAGTCMAWTTTRFVYARPELVELLEACAKLAMVLFLWCHLYFSIKQSQRSVQERERLRRAEAEAHEARMQLAAANPKEQAVGLLKAHHEAYVSRFTVRTGSRIHVVPAEEVAWISAAGDYTELHTRNAIHLLRETMNSLAGRLDPNGFARIHRSKIVNLARILELRSIENHEYIVKLCDGSEHRASRTYVGQLERWLCAE
jgi:DNA-binding LytR/AlgR family response regulator